jgi:hypothetical protein
MRGPRVAALAVQRLLSALPKFALLIALTLFARPASAQASAPPAGPAPRIGVLVMEPGEVFFERFGHIAILVQEGDRATSYNFGFFDPEEPGFLDNFVHGRMMYYLIPLPLSEDLAQYRDEGRGVTLQWLDLDPAQARATARDLAFNALPAHRRYRYDYYTDNCSTRVRDVLDRALGGRLKEQLSGRSRGNTWRSESVRLAWPAKWMAFGFHLGLGGAADRPLSRWEEAFIPMRLRESLREARRADGKPLVLSERSLVPHTLSLPPDEEPRWRTPALIIGLALAIGVSLLGARRPRLLAGLALPFWLVVGLAGSLMAFLWFGTEHFAAHGNENLLLLSPLALGLLPGGWRLMRGREAGRLFRILLWTLAGLAAVAAFLKFLPFRPQQNVEWVLMLLPLHLALARRLDARRA